MSLFKLKTLWSTTFPEQQFDSRHIALGNIDKFPSFVVASYKGTLRVFMSSSMTGKIVRQIFEKQFTQPIIDVRFVAHPDQSIKGNTIGILLFRKFVYLNLRTSEQNNDIYEAKLLNVQVQPSFGIIASPLSLTTLNSSIQSLNPKQVYPIKQADPIYPYTISLNNLYYMDGQDLVKCEGNIEQWRIIVGRVRSLHLIDTLVVIGQRELWEVDEGKILKSKKLQEQVSTGTIALKGKGQYNIIIANFLMQMFVYSSDYSLLWAVKLDYIPLRIIVCGNQLLKGAMLILTDNGSVELTYAGAQVQQRVLKPLQGQVNLQKVDKQTQYYLDKIRQLKQNPSKKNEPIVSNQSTSNDSIQVKAKFNQPQETNQFVDKSDEFYRENNKLFKCVLNVEILTQQDVMNNVVIEVFYPNNIYVIDQSKTIASLKGKQLVKFNCFISNEKFPYQCSVKVRIRYQKGNNVKFIQSQALIPIRFQCRVDSFQNLPNAQKKFTFKCSQGQLPTFNDLFGDIMQRGSGQQIKSISFCLMNGVKAAIVYNKSITKVKIQSQVYSGMCFIFLEFIRRIETYLQKNGEKLSVQVEVSLKELQNEIKDYHQIRETLKESFKELETKTQEFKKTQKKLLLKMKQKNSSVAHIQKLLQFTYDRILVSAQKYEKTIQDAQIVYHNFQVGLRFIMQLVYRRSSASKTAIQVAESIIKFDSKTQDVLNDQSWADRITKNSVHYLNKKYEATAENLQKLVTWVITKVNNGDWNQ